MSQYIGDDLVVVERQANRTIVFDKFGASRVVSGDWLLAASVDEIDRRDAMAARIAIRPRIDAHQPDEGAFDPGFLAQFPQCGVLHALAVVHEAAG